MQVVGAKKFRSFTWKLREYIHNSNVKYPPSEEELRALYDKAKEHVKPFNISYETFKALVLNGFPELNIPPLIFRITKKG